MGELVGYQPSDRLVENLRLIVHALDREENFPECMGVHDVQLPFRREPGTVLSAGRGDLGVDRKGGEEKDHAEGVVDISKSVDEGGVAGHAMRILERVEMSFGRTVP